MRELLRREAEGNASARLAIATYVLSLQKAIGQMVAALGGVDSLVFTGTIGERSSAIRQRVLRRLLYLDFVIDEQANDKDAHGTRVVSRLAHSRPVFVVPADENGQIALQTGHALAAQ